MVEQTVIYIILGTILLVVLTHLGKYLVIFKQFLLEKFEENKAKKYAKEYIKRQKMAKKIAQPTKFYGLFEFVLENCNDEKNFKKEFCSMMKDKLKSKYKDTRLQINATDKIFFNCDDFIKMDTLIDDFIKLYNFFVDINKKRNIRTELKFCIWTKPGHVNLQEAYKVLSELNNLNFVNKVISNEEIFKQYNKLGLKMFAFHPQGIVKLLDSDDDFELYRLVKNK